MKPNDKILKAMRGQREEKRKRHCQDEADLELLQHEEDNFRDEQDYQPAQEGYTPDRS